MWFKKVLIINAVVLISQGGLAQVANNSITSAKIKNNSVTSVDIRNFTIKNIDIKRNALTGTKIKNGSITGEDLANQTITSEQLANGAIDGAHLSDALLSDLVGAVGSIQLSFPDTSAATAATVYCAPNEEAIAASCGCNNPNNNGTTRNWGVMVDCRPFAGGAQAFCAVDSYLYKSYLPSPLAWVEATCLSVTDLAGRSVNTASGLIVSAQKKSDERLDSKAGSKERAVNPEEQRLQFIQLEQQRIDQILAK